MKITPIYPPEQYFMVKILEKWEILNFTDFHFKTHISLFYWETIKTVINIAMDFCTSILL